MTAYAIPENKLAGSRPERTVGLFSIVIIALFAGAGIAALLAIRNARNLGCRDQNRQTFVILAIWVCTVAAAMGAVWLEPEIGTGSAADLLARYLGSLSVFGAIAIASYTFARQLGMFLKQKEHIPITAWIAIRLLLILSFAWMFDFGKLSLLLTAGRLWP